MLRLRFMCVSLLDAEMMMGLFGVMVYMAKGMTTVKIPEKDCQEKMLAKINCECYLGYIQAAWVTFPRGSIPEIGQYYGHTNSRIGALVSF